MKKLYNVILQKIIKAYNICCEDLAEGIEQNNWKQAVLNFVLIALLTAGCAVTGLLLLWLVIKFWWVPLGIALIIVCAKALFAESDQTITVDPPPIDEVEKTLILERAIEQQDEVRALTFSAIQGASTTTPLKRPHDEYDIQPSRASGKSIYLSQDKVPVYQWEADLEGEIDKAQEDSILRELQRHVVKNLPRYPMLLSDEARGRAAVEVLDVKNLGGHVLIEMVLANATSIPLVDARRRARAERQAKQERIDDPRYS